MQAHHFFYYASQGNSTQKHNATGMLMSAKSKVFHNFILY